MAIENAFRRRMGLSRIKERGVSSEDERSMSDFSIKNGFGGEQHPLHSSAICVGFSEIDKYATAVYKRNFPKHKNWGDVTKIDAAKLPDFDLLVGGFSCQPFSIAGQRKGFEDTRGTVFFDIVRIAKEKRPKYLLLENVKGLLSSKTRTGEYNLDIMMEALCEIGYIIDFTLLNSKYFGVAQNRERILILAVREDMIENGKEITEYGGMENKEKNVRKSEDKNVGKPTSGDRNKSRFERYTELVGSLRGKPRPKVLPLQRSNGQIDEKETRSVSACLSATCYKGAGNDGMTLIQSGTLRTHNDGKGFREMKEGISPTIPARAREDGSGQPVIKVLGMAEMTTKKRAFDTPVEINEYFRSKRNFSMKKIAEMMKLPKSQIEHYFRTDIYRAVPQPEIYEQFKKILGLDDRYDKEIKEFYDKEMEFESSRRIYDSLGISPTISSANADKIVRAVLTPNRAIKNQNGRIIKEPDEPSFTLTNGDTHGVMEEAEVRRLTPLECERLQAFPDNWTEYGDFDGELKEISDTQRYKMMGNALTTNVVEAIIDKLYFGEGYKCI